MPDYAAQRQNMVELQVRPSDVPDPRIQAAMGAIARERFVPAAKRAVAYAETAIEVVPGRFLLEPRILAKLLLLADIGPEDRVLDIGGATGYGAAVLSRLAGRSHASNRMRTWSASPPRCCPPWARKIPASRRAPSAKGTRRARLTTSS